MAYLATRRSLITMGLEPETRRLLLWMPDVFQDYQQRAINRFMRQLKGTRMFQTGCEVFVPRILASENSALFDWKSATPQITKVGSASFTKGRGFVGNGVTGSRWDFNKAWSTVPGALQDDCGQVIYLDQPTGAVAATVVGLNTGSAGRFYAQNTNINVNLRCNSTSGHSIAFSSGVSSLVSTGRYGASLVRNYLNSAQDGSDYTDGSAALETAQGTMFYDGGGAGSGGNWTGIGLIMRGSAPSLYDIGIISTAFTAYRAAMV